MSQCSLCLQAFRSQASLHQHCRAREDHPYCVPCERLFTDFQGLTQHMDNASVHRYRDSNYWESDDDESSYGSLECTSCDRYFATRDSLLQHLAASSRHNWCFLCSRDFSSPSALDQHANSSVHKSRDISCPLCPMKFKVPSAIALHIESGACHNISRHQVTRAVQSLGAAATISVNRRLEGGSTSSGHIISYAATDRAWNGHAYECYICHRAFRTLPSLNTHLASPAHDADEFRCPKCKRTYKLVSGLIQHIESEVCGVARFQEVHQFAVDLSDRFKRLLMA